ncbi:MAG: RNA polymerase sigma factor [Verrucomicrobiota bacterium]
MTSPDSELIARAVVDHDRSAFGALVERHQSSVRHFLRHLTRGDTALADDLAQETFLQAFRGLASFRGDATVSTWLLGIAHNHWRNARRQRDRGHLPIDHEAVSEPSEPAGSRQSDLQHDLAGALRHLERDEQLAIHLNYQQGLSHSEISALLDWPVGTVKTHLARGKEKLRQLLAVWNPQT